RDVPLAGDENHRAMRRSGRERLLEREPVEIGHGDVQYSTAGQVRVVLGKEFARGRIGAHLIAAPAQQPRHRLEHPGVVVDEKDREGGFHHCAAMSSSCAGSENVATAPPALSFASERVPPCASTMVEQMVSPRPRPWLLVVKNGWNRRRFSPGRMPV